jgi:NAD(P)-dependent dehydrogenase (short-subunit alcohol dehydrogenase family)
MGADRQRWTAAQIPDQAGRVAVVTGANSGIGLEIAAVLASRGARVVLACRDLTRAGTAASQIVAASPGAQTSVVGLDLSSLGSVRAAAAELLTRFPRLDLLINNAGIMEVPRQLTADGFELHLATNHLGPFALTGLLLDRLAATAGSRIVTMSSQGYVDGVLNFGDLQSEHGYDPSGAYHQTKLANLLFTFELDRRLRAAGLPVAALAAHPGVVATDLFKHRSRIGRAVLSPRLRPLNFWFSHDVHMGALPGLRAAADQGARGGEFYGPQRRFDTGHPVVLEPAALARNSADQARLWAISEELTGVRYTVGAVPGEGVIGGGVQQA